MNYTAQSLIEMSDLRNQLIDRVEVLSRVKKLFLIPGIEMIPMRQVAEFYEVEVNTLRQTYKRNQSEIDRDGAKVIVGGDVWDMVQNVPDVKKLDGAMFSVPFGSGEIRIAPSKMTYFTPRAVLRIGMLLRDSEVAKEVRTQLLNTFEAATPEQKVEAIDEEGTMLLAIIRAGSPELMAVELGKYRDFMNRHIAKLETKVEELSEANGNLEEELKLLYDGAAKWGNKEVARKLIATTATRRLKPYGSIWNELYSKLNYACGMNLRNRKGGTIISRVHEDEWPKVLQQIALLARQAGVDIMKAIGELNSEMLETTISQ